MSDSAVDADKVLRKGNVEVTTHDGHPAIKIGDEVLQLRTHIEVEDDSESVGGRIVDAKAEVDADDHAWWNVYPDETNEPVEYPLVSIEPTEVEG